MWTMPKRTRNLKSKNKVVVFVRKLIKFSIDNYFISIFFACIAFVMVVSVYKLFFAKDTYVYTRVKVSQGLWWAQTARPNIWMVKAFKKGDVEKSLTGKPSVEIMAVRYYPWFSADQFETYLDLKLLVSGNPKTQKYNFKRSAIGVGAPIDLEFPTVQVSGTIIAMQNKPFIEKTVEKTLLMTKEYVTPLEYEAIQVGDSYFNGDRTVFTVLDKWQESQFTSYEATGNNYPIESEPRKHITVKAKVLLTQVKGQYFLGPEQRVIVGKNILMSTGSFVFEGYKVFVIE